MMQPRLAKYSNKVGEAIAVNGNPQEAIFSNHVNSSMNQQAVQLRRFLPYKRQRILGVFDAALGNVKPDNTSAIVAVQSSFTATGPSETGLLSDGRGHSQDNS